MAQKIYIMGSEFYLETCHCCKVPFAMNAATYEVAFQKKAEGVFYCPHGHPQVYILGESELSKAQREASRLRQQIAERDDRIKDMQNEHDKKNHRIAGLKGTVTKIKNRVANGVCPCCDRTFVNLSRHMDTKHPDYTTEAV